MAVYFSGFQEALDPVETTSTIDKVRDTGGDVLPFSHLDSRRFEVLAYRLKNVELGATGHRVTLMQGVGERGRDVVVYSPSGDLAEIIQCKNHSVRLTATVLRKELIKLALHTYIDSSILEKGSVVYELWCPSGLTEPAAKWLDTWPRGWTGAAMREDALEVIESYTAFGALSWDVIGEKVIENFQKFVTPRHVSGVTISERARACLPVYEAFFQGKVLMDRTDVFDAVRALMSEASGFSLLTDKDAQHILKRISSFSSEQRLVHTSGHVMGLTPYFVSHLNQNEFESFAACAIAGAMEMIKIVLAVCARLVNEVARKFRDDVRPNNNSIALIFSQVLNNSMIARVAKMARYGRKRLADCETYEEQTFRERLEHQARLSWDSCQRCLAGYDPRKHAYGSDEELRARIAVREIDGATNREEFERRLLQAVGQHLAELEPRFNKFMELVPRDLLLITDSMTVFENPALFERMVESFGAV
jgi:hypothetical protein